MDNPTNELNTNSDLKKRRAFMETRQDFQESWRLLKANFRAFNSTIIFAIGCSLFTVIILFGLVVWFYPASDVDTPGRFFIDSYFRWISVAIVLLILNIFINCQTGLAHDIMSSGDMFAEFKSSYHFFKKRDGI